MFGPQNLALCKVLGSKCDKNTRGKFVKLVFARENCRLSQRLLNNAKGGGSFFVFFLFFFFGFFVSVVLVLYWSGAASLARGRNVSRMVVLRRALLHARSNASRSPNTGLASCILLKKGGPPLRPLLRP